MAVSESGTHIQVSELHIGYTVYMTYTELIRR